MQTCSELKPDCLPSCGLTLMSGYHTKSSAYSLKHKTRFCVEVDGFISFSIICLEHVFYDYRNGDEYEGEWVEGYRHGHGELNCVDGSVYEGQWRADMFNGQGEEVSGWLIPVKQCTIHCEKKTDCKFFSSFLKPYSLCVVAFRHFYGAHVICA